MARCTAQAPRMNHRGGRNGLRPVCIDTRRLPALREPVEDTHRAKRVPPAGPALAVVHLEVGLARVDVLEWPPAVGIPIALDDTDRLRDALVGLDLGLRPALQAPQEA